MKTAMPKKATITPISTRNIVQVIDLELRKREIIHQQGQQGVHSSGVGIDAVEDVEYNMHLRLSSWHQQYGHKGIMVMPVVVTRAATS